MPKTTTLLVLLTFIASLAFAQQPCRRDDGIANMQSWFAKTPAASGGKYEAGPQKRQKIIKGYKKLKLRMTKSQVEDQLGLPDFESLYSTFNARIGNRAVSNPHCGWEWEYYFSKIGDNFANDEDSFVMLSFNSHGKLIWAKSQHVAGLKEIGSPE